MPERTEIGLLLVKAESTYGTDPTPTQAANIIPTVRNQLTWEVQSNFETRKVLDGTNQNSKGYVTMPSVMLKFRYELRGNRTDGTTADISAGAVGQLIELDPILKAADMTPTYTAEGSTGARDGYVYYDPVTSPITVGNSITCWWYTEGKLHKLVGGKADLSLVMEAGKMAYLDVTVYGKYVAITDNSFALSSPAFVSTQPPVWEGGTLSLAGVSTLVASQLTVNLGNKIVSRPSATAADNIAGFIKTSQEPNGRLNPESIPEATLPLWADWRGNTQMALLATIGSQTGNMFTVSVTTQAKKISYEDQNGVRIQPVEFDIVKTVPTASASNIFRFKFF